MALDLNDCRFVGSALPEPFVQFELSAQLQRRGLLTGLAERDWSNLRRQLRAPSGSQSVCNHVIAPLSRCLGFRSPERQEPVATREGREDAGWLLRAACGTVLRAWTYDIGTDLGSPQRSGRAYRFSPLRSASRVLIASGERVGLLTDGEELRLLLCDPVRPDSHIVMLLGGSHGWRTCPLAPDSFRLLRALASAQGIEALPEILDAARLSQTRVTKNLRLQARHAIEGFLQAVLDHPDNGAQSDLTSCAGTLWRESLSLVYRLLFVLKLESTADTALAFSFASTRLWHGALSPNRALAPLARRLLDHGHATGRLLEDGLRLMFRVFRDGLSCSELSIAALGGALFGAEAMPLLDRLVWGERAVALLLDRLLWTAPKSGARERVHYGSLDVEELGRVYEALLELEPGIAMQPTVAGHFFLHAGNGRKASGSFYTPHPFVRFLVHETLAPQIAKRSPDDDPDPCAILALNVVDPAMGSGHFLVETCRYLAEALYAACRLCDELAAADLGRADVLRARIAALPDPDGLLWSYLPSRSSEGSESGVSEARALSICRRLVAVNCLYGVDSNRLAVELAKLSLWLESYAEGLPLTFLDHRLLHGNSLTGCCFDALMTLPVSGTELDPLLARDVSQRLQQARHIALREVRALQATIGADAADMSLKAAAKRRADAALLPLRLLAQAWSGAAMLSGRAMDDEWQALARAVAEKGLWPDRLEPRQADMLAAGSAALPWDLAFPEVFARCGFDAVLSNPPWDIMQPNAEEFLGARNLPAPDDRTARRRLLVQPAVAAAWLDYRERFARQHRIVRRIYRHQRFGAQGAVMGGKLDLYRVFAERMLELAGPEGAIGMVVPSAFHANEGATGVRALYLEHTCLEQCLSFENRKHLFGIDSRYKFALVVARRPGPTRSVNCGFYLTDPLDITDSAKLVQYPRLLIEAAGGIHHTLLELRHRDELVLAQLMFQDRQPLGKWLEQHGISLSRELHMTDDAPRFLPAVEGATDHLPLHEGKTIHQFSDKWNTAPRYAVAACALTDKPRTVEAMRYYRAACRDVAGATNERTAIATLLPPGVVCGHTISVERSPGERSNAQALLLVALMNSFPFDWLLRLKAASHVSLYILADLPVPRLPADAQCLLVHAALRLCCNHAGFAPLWREQLGDIWREASPGQTWPIVSKEHDRWHLRAAIDAVVAQCYGLDRAQYERLLAGFSHKSFPDAPALCVAAFDRLLATSFAMFCRSNDPYADIPLLAAHAQPVIPPPPAPLVHLPGNSHHGGRRFR